MMHARYSNGMTISQVHFQDGTQTKLLLDSSGEPSPQIGEHSNKKKDLVKKRNDSIVDVEEKFGNEGNDDDMEL